MSHLKSWSICLSGNLFLSYIQSMCFLSIWSAFEQYLSSFWSGFDQDLISICSFVQYLSSIRFLRLIVSKFNFRRAELIRLGQLWLLLFLLISLFIYFSLGLKYAIEKKLVNPSPKLRWINKLISKNNNNQTWQILH